MAIAINDYLIDQAGIDWPEVLVSWSWILPTEFTLWLVNRFAELFLVLPDGTVHRLDTGAGQFVKVAESRDDFCDQIDLDDNANDWLMIPLVDQLVANGIFLKPGQCYGFKIPTSLGGKYSIENCGPLPIADYLSAFGSIHAQLKDLPDGSQVELKVINPAT